MDAERRAIGDRLDHLLEEAVGEQLDDRHPDRRVGARASEGDQDRERARTPGAEVRDVRTEERDGGDRSGKRDTEQQGSSADHDRVERRD